MSAALSHRYRYASVDRRLNGGFVRDNTTLSYLSGRPIPEANLPTARTPQDNTPVDTDAQEPEIHRCPHCEKQFGRLCDLNKHAKSHSRPFKCAVQDCKYSWHGWPTAKELDRHVNDKHSAAPRTYPCHYPNCSYKSKRESNCKQHMEKTHGWTYTRSKSNGKRVSRRVGSQVGALKTAVPTRPPQPLLTSSRPSNPHPPQSHGDFVLFPPDQDHAAFDDEYDDDDGHMDLDSRGSQSSDMVIPWTSPESRLRRRETFLERFTQNFNNPEDDVPIDPQLSSVGGMRAGWSDAGVHSGPSSVQGHTERTAAGVPIKQEHTPSATTQTFPGMPFTLALQQRPAGGAPPSHHSRNSSTATVTQAAVTSSMSHSVYQVSTPRRRREDDDPEDNHPQKKFKPSPVVDFKESQMPDIFVKAHPDMYNRETKSLYQSCETEHRDISTLVRHLGRAPHRLHVSERCIHSFDVVPEELSHTRRGVCRRCWVVFPNRDSLENHLFSECEKVSRGKREKWRILYDTFTPLATDSPSLGHGQVPANASHNPTRPNATSNNQSVYGGASAYDDDSPVAPPSPTTIDLGPRLPLEVEEELERLRRENNQVKAERGQFRAILRTVVTQAKGVMDLSRLVPPHLLEAVGAAGNELTSGSGSRFSRRLTFPANGFVENETPDAAALVGQMNSHPTDVDRQGMMEDIQETFSRTSSGLSSSGKSSVHHVSNSPPQRYEAYHGEHAQGSRPRPVNPVGGPTPDRHQPTSLPDSGYGSDKKLGSVVSLEVLSQQRQSCAGFVAGCTKGEAVLMRAAVPNTPFSQPHAPIPAAMTQHQDQPAANPLSPSPARPLLVEKEPNPQPGPPAADSPLGVLPSSGMSPDLFAARQDDEDAYFLSEELMEQFGDPGYSQPSSSFSQS